MRARNRWGHDEATTEAMNVQSRRRFLKLGGGIAAAGAALLVPAEADANLRDHSSHRRAVKIPSGSRPPAKKQGKVGSFYLDTKTEVLYGPKSTSKKDPWGKGKHLPTLRKATGPIGADKTANSTEAVSVVGPRGETGGTGATGATGGTGARGATGATGATGAGGAAGATGATGAAGANGYNVYVGSGTPPASEGRTGDSYIDDASGAIYGPKTSSGWGIPAPLEVPVSSLPASVVSLDSEPTANRQVPTWNGFSWVPGTPNGSVPSGTTAQTVIFDGTTARAAAPAEISLLAFGADPTGKTDSSVAIQNWVNAVLNAGTGQTGKAEAGNYIYGTQIMVYNLNGFKLKGEPGCSFTWTGGAGSGSAFCFHSCQGAAEGITFTFSDTAYDGNLVDCDWGAHAADVHMSFWQCTFGNRHCQTPRCVLRLNHTIISSVRECQFFGGQYGVMVGDGDYVIAIDFQNNAYNFAAIAHIYANGGPSETLRFSHETFEPLSTGMGGAFLWNKAAVGGDGTRGLRIENCWFGDVTASGGNGQINVFGTALTIDNNRFYSGLGVPCVALNGSSALIMNNDFQVSGDADGNIIAPGDVGHCMLIGNNLTPPTNGFANNPIPFMLGNGDTHGHGPMTVPGVLQITEGTWGTGGESFYAEGTQLGPLFAMGRWSSTLGSSPQIVGSNLDQNINIMSGPSGAGALQTGISSGAAPLTVFEWLYNSGNRALGFFGAKPVSQPTAAAKTTGYTAGTSTQVTIDGKLTGGVGSTAYTLGDVVAALKNLGLLAS